MTLIPLEDLQIIQKLEKNPLMSFSELAQELRVSWPTAKRRVTDLKARGIIREPVGVYNIDNLNLNRISILWSLENPNQLAQMEKFCDLHPYTHFRARGYGSGFILFTQFNVPLEITPLIKELRVILKEKGCCVDSQLLESSGRRVETFSELDFFDPNIGQWYFDWNNWIDSFLHQPERISLPEPAERILLETWDLTDFKILRMLTANTEIKQAEIMRELKLTRTETHRRYNRVFENLISGVRLSYDRTLFDLVDTQLFLVKNIDERKSCQFYHLMKSIPPPFRMGLDILKDESFYLWSKALPSNHGQQLVFSLWKIFNSFETYILDSNEAILYWFYPDNFDFEHHYWKTSRKYVVDDPITALETSEV